MTVFNPISSSSTGLGLLTLTSGAVDGSNQVFVWSGTPKIIGVDQGRIMQKVNVGNGEVNWTGTTTTTLEIAPTTDVWALG